MKVVTLLVVLVFIPAAALSTTYLVNPEGTGDYPTIQAAVDSAQAGDIIELTDGLFAGEGNRDVDFLGKAVTVRSQSGDPEACVITCGYLGRGFFFHSGEDLSSVLNGLTVAYGYEQYGAAIRCLNSSPTIANCILRDNHAISLGGAIMFHDSSAEITGCIFRDNVAAGGGALNYDGTDALFSNCTFIGNEAPVGGAIHVEDQSDCVFAGCTLYANTSSIGSGIYSDGAHLSLHNCIIAYGQGGGAVAYYSTSSFTITCCDIYGNLDADWVGLGEHLGILGNICEDPFFCDADNGDLTLHAGSPCAPFTPPNEGCELIGAWLVACDDISSVPECDDHESQAWHGVPVSWGRIKGMFREDVD
ncbi:right-handed parallel beta-helix repeat-containing protein [Candidatus Eisenbacteria bacterium]|uniref:Right-handed parallel beta-helix repeat-containing protein n=1 Tax=Eiseniibacteriota bacterium TaxID=2212470 RepID=A0ABV6YJD7_UNCEI